MHTGCTDQDGRFQQVLRAGVLEGGTCDGDITLGHAHLRRRHRFIHLRFIGDVLGYGFLFHQGLLPTIGLPALLENRPAAHERGLAFLERRFGLGETGLRLGDTRLLLGAVQSR